MTKQWIVYSPEVDLYYFDNYDAALKEYEELKEYLMGEGHELGTQVHLLETIKVATSVIDEEKMKISSPKDEGFEWDNWAKWVELNATIEWEHSYEKEAMERGTLIEKQQQEIERLNAENNKLKDFIEETDVDRLETASEIINEAMMELIGQSIEDHKESKKDFIKKKKENQESRDRILKSIEDQKQRFESRREKFDKHFGNKR
ncbi:hypothetical protein [Cytobacillus horneckiae]|uniref:hypothetical protein n=1 Tax=Cytobacillus horneckiae TaxID=549687 RepID=UPI0020407C46|nr:hypothetical protein [Cytobacillus horneckiae]MCM3180206.1 hypothetical protein [Cytobacillus horneckiae]